jgi:hypothetical protein
MKVIPIQDNISIVLMLNAVTVGAVVSGGGVEGLLVGSPGRVNAAISCRFVNPSPSESSPSMAEKVKPASLKEVP